MSYELQILPEAEMDALDAQDWHDDAQYGLGDRFLERLIDCYESIQLSPLSYQVHRGAVRRKPLKVFKYTVYYLVQNKSNEVVILAVWHQHRNPADLNDRLAPFA